MGEHEAGADASALIFIDFNFKKESIKNKKSRYKKIT